MTIRKKTYSCKREIDISGPAGNAYALMGEASSLARQLGFDKKVIIDEMTSGDYERLLEVFDRYFGEFVDIVR